MRIAGLDIGSRTIKVVVLENNNIVFIKKALSSHDPLKVVHELLQNVHYDRMVATGYGRYLVNETIGCPIISEIKAFALGAWVVNQNCGTILDIGGQDTKAISLNEKGELSKFEMNDRCAAGTGRFLEIMAHALGYTISEFPEAACSANQAEKINSMCTVFAESEVISLITKGAKREEVALGIHKAIVNRSITLLKRVGLNGEIFFAGGVAFNKCIKELIEKELKHPVFVPQDPQIIGALGAAIYGSKDYR